MIAQSSPEEVDARNASWKLLNALEEAFGRTVSYPDGSVEVTVEGHHVRLALISAVAVCPACHGDGVVAGGEFFKPCPECAK